jgi:thiol:disulfide interchange protein DsbD
MMKLHLSKSSVSLLFFALSAACGAQSANQIVQWSIVVQEHKQLNPGAKAIAALEATIKDGWHVYALSQVPGGPIPLTVKVPDNPVFTTAGVAIESKPESFYDKNFDMETQFYKHSFSIKVPLAVKATAPLGDQTAEIDVKYQMCNDNTCLPPAVTHLALQATIVRTDGKIVKKAGLATTTLHNSTGLSSKAAVTEPLNSTIVPGMSAPLVPPVPSASTSSPTSTPASPVPPSNLEAHGFGSFIWLAIVMGALSLLTPCVFPMIPITVSYFANHAGGSRRASIGKAAVYAGGIILTFSAVGMLLAAIFGAGGVNRLAANPWVNLFITAVFLVFALSLFGAFFFQVPTRLTQRLDSLSRMKESSGTVGALLMGILFTLTSFTCTAPFVGTLLVMATEGNWRWPLAGMVAFSTIFAIPFFVLALAPQIVSNLPRAGGWMNSVKVVMGFLEIAAAMKFLSNADLIFGWGIFTHQAVLSIWIAIGLLLVLYILGAFYMSHDSPVKSVGAVRILLAILFLAITVWMVAGLFGHSMGELEAFLPPPTQESATSITLGSVSNSQTGPQWVLNNLPEAEMQAAQQHKPIFVDFTGYTCTNCRWMEANMFSRPDIQSALSHFVLVRLYTDGDGKIYEDQQNMQNNRFGTVALPLYVLLTPQGATISTFPGLTRDPQQFLEFLSKAMGA